MSWIEYLLFRMDECIEDESYARDWLFQLDADMDSQILGLSLALDLASHALKPSLLAEVLTHLPNPSSSVCDDFLVSIEDHGACRFCSPCKNDQYQGDRYARVMGLYEFFAYSYKDSYGVSWSEEDINDLRLALQEKEGLSLGEIDAGFSGVNNTNWISKLSEIAEEIGECGNFLGGAATTIADCLGLPEKRPIIVGSPPELLLVAYPDNLELEVWRPTTIDGFWLGGFFLSCDESDGWGRTQSCSGSYSSKSERIHKGLITLTHDFRAWYIGIMEPIPLDRAALHSESLARWERMSNRLATSQNLPGEG